MPSSRHCQRSSNERAGPTAVAVAWQQGVMTAPLKVVAAMSGGVDSAVAAARAVDAGHEVVGVHLAVEESLRLAAIQAGVAARCLTP